MVHNCVLSILEKKTNTLLINYDDPTNSVQICQIYSTDNFQTKSPMEFPMESVRDKISEFFF